MIAEELNRILVVPLRPCSPRVCVAEATDVSLVIFARVRKQQTLCCPCRYRP